MLIKSGGFEHWRKSGCIVADLDRAMGEAQLRRKDREADSILLI